MSGGTEDGRLAVEGVTLRRRERSLLSKLWLHIDPGEVVAVMGPSGAGKTTLLRTVAGLAAPDSGCIKRPGDRVAVVFQDPRLLPWRTALENVELVCGPDGKHRALDWLGRVGLAGESGLYPSALSGGMRQRVAVPEHWRTAHRSFWSMSPSPAWTARLPVPCATSWLRTSGTREERCCG